MALKDIAKKIFTKDPRMKEMENELRRQKKVEAKQKNSNERELDRFREERRQEMIKKELDKYRKQRQDQLWRGPTILDTPNVMKGHPSILIDNKKFMNGMKMQRHPNSFFK